MYSSNTGLFDSFELRGKWWLPERPDDRVHGTASYSPGGPIKLRLDGKFTRSKPEDSFAWLRNPYSALKEFNAECILGETIEEERCTLHRAFASHISSTETYTANALVIGEWFNKTSEFAISGALVGYTNLEEWSSVNVLRQEPGATPDDFRVAVSTSPTRVLAVSNAANVRELTLFISAGAKIDHITPRKRRDAAE